jgi:type I restriction enzyme, S subunit
MNRSWPMIALGEVLKLQRRWVKVDPLTDYTEIGIRSYGRGIFHKSPVSGTSLGNKRVLRIEPGDLVFMNVFAWEGAVAVAGANEAGKIGSHRFATYTPINCAVDPHFLRLYFRTPPGRDLLGRVSPGSAGRNRTMNLAAFSKQPIPLPPIDQQRRIVARIEALAGRIAVARTLREQTVQEANVLVGRVIAELFLKGKQNGWKPGILGDYVSDDCYGTSERTTDDVSGTPILRMGNIQKGRLKLTDLKYLHIAPKDREKLFLKPGDIVVNRTNSAELVGKCAVFNLNGEYGFASYLIRLRLDQERADPQLIATYINSPAGRAYMFNERKQMTGQANVNSTKLKALPIALPPMIEQRRIVTYLDGLSAKAELLKFEQQQSAAELNALLPSILDRAFKGEL